MNAPCTTCGGRCPTPQACQLPIQPSAEEIRRDRLDAWKDRAAYASVIVGLVLITASLALASGCMRG